MGKYTFPCTFSSMHPTIGKMYRNEILTAHGEWELESLEGDSLIPGSLVRRITWNESLGIVVETGAIHRNDDSPLPYFKVLWGSPGTPDYSKVFRIHTSGSVGIGTAIPSVKINYESR